jgi:hypothetical protein
VGLPISSFKVSMTLSTGGIFRVTQKSRALVFDVTGRARGSERLIGVMKRRVVACQASRVGYVRGERAGLRNVAESALLREYGVRVRERSAGIDFLAALRALCQEPSERNRGNCHRQPETPAPKRVRVREVLQINALGEFLGCSCSS